MTPFYALASTISANMTVNGQQHASKQSLKGCPHNLLSYNTCVED